MAPTTTKGIRITADQQAWIDRIRVHYPETRTEAEFLYRALVIGLRMLAAQASATTLADAPAYGGASPTTLAVEIERDLLPVLPLLLAHGTGTPFFVLPVRIGSAGEAPAAALPRATDPLAPIPHPFVAGAADDLDALGTDFLDDAED